MHWLSTSNWMKENSSQIAIQHLNQRERRGRGTRQERLQQLPLSLVCLPTLKMYLSKHLKIILNHIINLKYQLLSKSKMFNKILNLIKVNQKKQNNRTNNNNNRINRNKEVKQRIKRKKEVVLIKTSYINKW